MREEKDMSASKGRFPFTGLTRDITGRGRLLSQRERGTRFAGSIATGRSASELVRRSGRASRDGQRKPAIAVASRRRSSWLQFAVRGCSRSRSRYQGRSMRPEGWGLLGF